MPRKTAENVETIPVGPLGIIAMPGCEALCDKIDAYNVELGIPKTLREFGIEEKEFNEKIAKIAELAVGDACTGSNPRAITPVEMEKLFRYIYDGKKIDF